MRICDRCGCGKNKDIKIAILDLREEKHEKELCKKCRKEVSKIVEKEFQY